jgi:hypothetical protein
LTATRTAARKVVARLVVACGHATEVLKRIQHQFNGVAVLRDANVGIVLGLVALLVIVGIVWIWRTMDDDDFLG